MKKFSFNCYAFSNGGDHRRSQGVQWVHLHPQGKEKNRRNLRGKFVSAPHHTKCTPRQSKSQFWDIFAVWEDLELLLVVSDLPLKAKTKKDRKLFEGKSAPQTKSWLRLWWRHVAVLKTPVLRQ